MSKRTWREVDVTWRAVREDRRGRRRPPAAPSPPSARPGGETRSGRALATVLAVACALLHGAAIWVFLRLPVSALQELGWTWLLAATLALGLSVWAIVRCRRKVQLVLGWNVSWPVVLLCLLLFFRAAFGWGSGSRHLLQEPAAFAFLVGLLLLGLAGLVVTARAHWHALRQEGGYRSPRSARRVAQAS